MRAGVLMTLANKVIVLGVGLTSSIVIARALGPQGRGGFAAAVALATMLVQVGSLGITSANPLFAAREPGATGKLVTNSLWIAAVAGGCLAALMLAIRGVAPSAVRGLTWTEVAVAGCIVPAMLSMLFLQSVFLGQGRMVVYNAVEASTTVLQLLALVALSATTGLDVTLCLSVTLGTQVAAALIYLVLLQRHRPPLSGPDAALMRRMARFAAKIWATGLLSYAVIRLDVLLVNGILGSREAGFYSLAVTLVDMVCMVPLVVALNLYPRILGATGPDLTVQTIRTLAPCYLALCAAVAAVASPLITTLYGHEFDPSVPLFWWLAPGAFCMGMLNLVTYHYAANGYPTQIVGFWAVALVINLAINVALLDPVGTVIASIASSAAYALLLALHLRMFRHEIGGLRMLVPRASDFRSLVRPRTVAER